MNFAIYMIGALLLIVGLGYAAYLMGIGPTWIGVGVLVIIGLLIMVGVSKSHREPSPQ